MNNIELQIEYLRGRFGSFTNVARRLGVTYRQLSNIRNGQVTKTMRKLIRYMVNEEKGKEAAKWRRKG
jgi:hypothetical protein